MKKFTVESGVVMPLDRANVDTDFIIPKQFLKSIKRSGFGVNLFDDQRLLEAAGADELGQEYLGHPTGGDLLGEKILPERGG